MKLTCQVLARKMTMRTLHFFVWKRYTLPNNKIVSSQTMAPLIDILRAAIDSLYRQKHVASINRSVLEKFGMTSQLLCQCGLEYFADEVPSSPICYSPELKYQFRSSISAFRPCSDNSYIVLSDSGSLEVNSLYSQSN
ncbi:hypothetical protein EIN_374680 [Entamoeba invadens IP1]|uniref:Uncharacterized protein n=1 Tax=Entamoeba invadens IP1 TaxID=370355 RepID=A0A0A1TVW5_ENTIV|nr:hypothetical protein EIN_374680 [Entamoeba invadens IP1]ELP83423.1 hypothetical protein EIN_374680 [Entamoeba invadens IP1]|eukprot:XP_004182769.1 hypothetical protein EIN_374680 [Entamoeba invadens IP1]